MKHFPLKNNQTQQIFAALILTGILSLGAGMTQVSPASAHTTTNPESFVGLKQRNREIPRSVVIAVRREIARTYRIPPGQLKFVSYTQQSWPDSCLGLSQSGEACSQVMIENGWRIVMSNSRQTWEARTDSTGRVVRLEGQGNSSNSNLPNSVANAVLREASRRTGLPISQLGIVQSRQMQGSSSCLGLPPLPGQGCTKDLVPLWQVSVEAEQQRLVYHTNGNGSRVRLNEAASNLSDASLPRTVTDAVLRVASQDLRVPSSQLRITSAQQQVWRDSCLGLPRSNERCMGSLTPGWQVTVEGRKTVQVYRTDDSGSRIRSEAILGQQPNGDLPNSVAQAVLQDAARRSNLSSTELRIVQAEQRDWPNGCLGLAERGIFCTQAIVPGWWVMVEGRGEVFAYRTNESGSVIKLESGATQGNSGAVPIAESELPGPLTQGVVFRALEGGGITGSTTETVLTNDGRVIRRYTNSAIMAPVQMHQISRIEYERFLHLLQRQNFAQFDRLAYPAPPGAADYITVTLTSQAGTTSYADMDVDRLPESLQAVAQAWRKIAIRR